MNNSKFLKWLLEVSNQEYNGNVEAFTRSVNNV